MRSGKPQLRALPRTDQEPRSPSGLGPALGDPRPPKRPVRRTAPGRPWDHITPWWLPPGPATQRLAAAAADHGVTLGLAASLVIERSLCTGDLEAIFAPAATIITALDHLASEARPTATMSGAEAAYLRQLTASGTAGARPANGPDAPVCLPGRVAVRLPATDDAAVCALLNGDLGIAVAWERAAVLQGRTIAEWAMWQTVRLRAR